MSDELKTAVVDLGKAFEEFKAANDTRLAEITAKGAADGVTEEKVDRINGDITRLTDVVGDLEKRMNRPRPGAAAGDVIDADQAEHKTAFLEWARQGREFEPELRQVARANLYVKAVSTGTAAAGGFAVPEVIARDIAKRVNDASVMRGIALVETAATPDYKKLIDLNGVAHAWVAEGGTVSESATPQLREVSPTFGKSTAYPKTTEESLQDIFFNVETWLMDNIVDSFTVGEGAAFVAGDGTNKPTGFITSSTPAATADASRTAGVLEYVPSGAAADITNPDVLITLAYTLQATYRANARWLMAKATVAKVRKMKDSNDQYLWQPGLQAGQPSMLLGYPAEEDEEMPAVAANSFSIAFGDFRRGYLIVDRPGMFITRDEITTPGQVKFYVRRRTGGELTEDRAIKLLKTATS